MFTSWVTDEQMNGRMNGVIENIMPSYANLALQKHKIAHGGKNTHTHATELFLLLHKTQADNTSLTSTPNAIARRTSPIAVSCEI